MGGQRCTHFLPDGRQCVLPAGHCTPHQWQEVEPDHVVKGNAGTEVVRESPATAN